VGLPFVEYEDIGQASYKETWDYQIELQQSIIHTKRNTDKTPINKLIFCEHNPVYTLGKSGDIDNLVFDEERLAQMGIEFHKTNRGGDITYHGPGQITGYPIFDLDQFYNDVHRYVRDLEEVVIRTIADFGLEGKRLDGFTGVWLAPNDQSPQWRKICAIGVHMSRWVSIHGFALNVNTDLMHFMGIVPCGIAEDSKTVTSMQKELGNVQQLDKVKSQLRQHFSKVYNFQFTQVPSDIMI